MATVVSSPPSIVTSVTADRTLADLVERLGGIPLNRIRAVPPPGTATKADVVAVESRSGRVCELVEGVLVEKAMGFRESLIAGTLIQLLRNFVDSRDAGLVLGEAGMMEILPNLVRIPDVSFVSWRHFPEHEVPEEPIPAVAPDLAIEILSRSNTPAEMKRKLGEYLQAGVRIVWFIDCRAGTADIYTSARRRKTVDRNGTIDGGDVLPGFEVSLKELFSRSEGRQPKRRGRS